MSERSEARTGKRPVGRYATRFGLPLLFLLPVHVSLGQAPGEVTGLGWCAPSKACLLWSAAPNTASYKVYQGAASGLPDLLTSAVDSCLVGTYSGNTTGTGLGRAPDPGALHWYLVTAVNPSGEGTAGNASAGPRIVNSSGDCQIECATAADCPILKSCNFTSHVCESACGGGVHTDCHGGCCDGNICVAGMANSACGSSGGACSTCVNAAPTCEAGVCTSTCGGAGNGTCAGGNCCSNGHCVSGGSNLTCGSSGTCVDCSLSPQGHHCLVGVGGPGTCGCLSETDCQAANPGTGTPGQACEGPTRSCTSICGVQEISPCNGGCCSGSNGHCVVGTSPFGGCGVNGQICSDCFNTCGPGTSCLANGSCGCASDSACSSLACGNRHSCSVTSASCCVGKNGPCTSGTQCCSGSCAASKCVCIPAGTSCQGNTSLCCSNSCNGATGLCQ